MIDRLSRPARMLAVTTTAFALAACIADGEPGGTATISTPAPSVVATATPMPMGRTTMTPSPTASVDMVDGLPAGVVGPLLIYREEVGRPRAGSRSWPRIAITTYDLGAGGEVASFEVGEAGIYVASTVLVGREVLVGFEHALEVYALDGEHRRTLRTAPRRDAPGGPPSLGDVAVSHDGALVALAESPSPQPVPFGDWSILILDMESGEELLAAPLDHPGFEGLGIELRPAVWRDDGAGVVVSVITNYEAGARVATVMLDGSVRLHDTRGFTYVSRDGRRVAHGTESLGCMFISGDSISLTDLDTGAVLNRVEDERFSLTPHEWSPDGSELLYAARPFPEDEAEVQACRWPTAGPEWLLLPADGRPTESIRDPIEAHERWYGQATVTFICEGESEAGWYSRFNLMLRAPGECLGGGGPPSDIVYDGRVIGSGEGIWVLGQIEVDAP